MILRTWIHDFALSLLLVLSICVLASSAPKALQLPRGPKLPIPTWPPDDAKPATAGVDR